MNLKLTFDEKVIREIHEEILQTIKLETIQRIKTRKKTTIVFTSISIFFFLLTFLHSDWILYGFIFAGISFVYTMWTYIPIIRKRIILTNTKNEVEKFINKYNSIDGIEYTYDDKKISYFEYNKLVENYFKADIDFISENDQWFSVYFRNPKRNIWIPKRLSDEEQYNDFLNNLNSFAKTRANKA